MSFVQYQQRAHPIRYVKPLVRNVANVKVRKVAPLPSLPPPQQPTLSSYKIQFKNIKDWFTQNLYNYCETTSLHGLNYIVQPDISRNERIFWIAIVIISIIVSIALVIVSWTWNRDTPTVTVIESSHFPTWNIPFPAVTICSFNKISKRKAMALAKKMQRPANISEAELLELFRVTMYFSFVFNFTEINYELVENILLQNNYTIQQLSDELTPNCMDSISRCIWKGTHARCDSLFQRVNTTEGVCCSFNYFGEEHNNFPAKIAYQVPKHPYRVTGCGYPTGLSVVLDVDMEDYFGTYFSSYGFRLLIHDAYNFPDENAETKMVTSTRESFVRINPEATYATNDVKSLNAEMRNCLFAKERQLSVMQRYTFVNCMFECRLQTMYKHCGCIPINLPNNGSYPTCGIGRITCVTRVKDVFFRALVDIKDPLLSRVKNIKEFPCNCIPDCEAFSYASEITMGRLNAQFGGNSKLLNSTNAVENTILLHVFYSDLLSTRYRKEVYQNWLSALASFGGLLGLIMGFSIVTAFEFLYFLTFRPIFTYFNNE